MKVILFMAVFYMNGDAIESRSHVIEVTTIETCRTLEGYFKALTRDWRTVHRFSECVEREAD